jgi:hypothetical protein
MIRMYNIGVRNSKGMVKVLQSLSFHIYTLLSDTVRVNFKFLASMCITSFAALAMSRTQIRMSFVELE